MNIKKFVKDVRLIVIEVLEDRNGDDILICEAEFISVPATGAKAKKTVILKAIAQGQAVDLPVEV